MIRKFNRRKRKLLPTRPRGMQIDRMLEILVGQLNCLLYSTDVSGVSGVLESGLIPLLFLIIPALNQPIIFAYLSSPISLTVSTIAFTANNEPSGGTSQPVDIT